MQCPELVAVDDIVKIRYMLQHKRLNIWVKHIEVDNAAGEGKEIFYGGHDT